MEVLSQILAIIGLAFILNVLFAQSNNFIFMLAKKPLVWVLCIAIIGYSVFWVSAFFDWNHNTPIFATLIVLIVRKPSLSSSEEKSHSLEIFEQLGIRSGVLYSRMGYFAYLGASVFGYIQMYSVNASF
ncbi:hypothetical protein FGD67_06505 [Colwellia sp. M166]|jgi:hypothetical protein|uniref:hypothetical protein n=1 Tax=Colwellia sp. M166 TaxID=2583805 RepID=UPI00211E1B30|nr:hypothetical protein [Colwellia sp. M166]UUO22878.1 hypothetical protein FGD67_06505 [Colwellia sp. M166]|tara:strand:+ start:40687 stop:41073 length:387 start_codon:yes stop_codon:yes gene_type:complete